MRRLALVVTVALLTACAQDTEATTSTPQTSSPVTTEAASPGKVQQTEGRVWGAFDDVVDVEIAPDGQIWTAGSGGVVAWDPSGGSARTFTIEAGLGSNVSHRIAVTSDGVVAVAHGYQTSDVWWGPDVSVLVGQTWETSDLDGPDGTTRWSVAIARDGTLWAYGGDTSFVYRNGEWMASDGGLSGSVPSWVGVDADGSYWVPYWGVALIHLPVGQESALMSEDFVGAEFHVVESYRAEAEAMVGPDGIASVDVIPDLEYVMGAAVDDGTVWALGGPGLARWDGVSWQTLAVPELTFRTIRDVRSGDGITWVGTDVGLGRILEGKFEWFLVEQPVHAIVAHLAPHQDGVIAVSVPAFEAAATKRVRIAEISEGSAGWADDTLTAGEYVPNLVIDSGGRWLTVKAGTGLIDYTTGEAIETSQPYMRDLIRLAIDGEGTVWAEVEDAIWYLHDDIWVEAFAAGDGEHYPGPAVADAETGMWMASDGGILLHIDKTGIDFTSSPSGLSDITAIAVDGGDVIVAGRGAVAESSVGVWDGTDWRTYSVGDEPMYAWPTVVARDAEGTIWVGDGSLRPSEGPGSGLLGFSQDGWRLIRSGLPSPDVLSMVPTESGELWVGTAGGLALIDPAEMESTRTGTVRDVMVAPTTTKAVTPDVDLRYSTITYGLYPGPLPGSDGYSGSGCSPGTDDLPDGIWWGYLREFTATSVTFDLACIRLNNDPAEEVGWVIENNNQKLRTVAVAPDALVICEWAGCPAGPYPYTEWIADSGLPHGDLEPDVGVWLFVNGGVVTEIVDMIIAG